MLTRTLSVAAGSAVVLAGLSAPALAAWVSNGSASATGTATTLQPVTSPAATPSTSAPTSSIAISWSAPAGTAAPSSYRVDRVSPAATVCSVPASTTSCTDTGLSPSTTYTYRITSVLGQWNGTAGQTSSTTVSADTTAPTTTASVTGTSGTNGWYTSNVTVTLNAADGGAQASGVKDITHSATGAGPITSTTTAGSSATAAFTAEGSSTLTFSGRDNAGNVETAKTLEVKIDKTAPVVGVPTLTAANGGANYTVSGALGTGATVASTTVTMSGGTTGSCAVTAGSTAGTYAASCTNVFKAKGQEATRTTTFTVRQTDQAGLAGTNTNSVTQ